MNKGHSDWNVLYSYWCRRRDLNPHGFTRLILSQVRLPFRHSGIYCFLEYKKYDTILYPIRQVFFEGEPIFIPGSPIQLLIRGF
jgi:hypothetical protein